MKYAPILRWKKGEKLALTNLSEERANQIKPIIEIVDFIDFKIKTKSIWIRW